MTIQVDGQLELVATQNVAVIGRKPNLMQITV